MFALFTLLRIVLSLLFPPSGPVQPIEWLRVFGIGVHLDLAASVLLAAPMSFWVLLGRQQWWDRRWHRILFFGCNFLCFALLTFLLVAEGYFFEEFRSRYNPVAIDYLIFPHEVFVNVWQSYPLVQVILACGVSGLMFCLLVVRNTRGFESIPASRGGAIVVAGACLLLPMTVSPGEHRLSMDRVINELSNNTFVSLWSAISTRNLDYPAFYPTLPGEEAFGLARRLVGCEEGKNSESNLVRNIVGDPARPRLNVILLLEESLGSEFWGCLGRQGETLTPRMDQLATREGLLFENLYADGNRTIRGYEGVFCSFPPLPGDSIVARDRTRGVETLAAVLGRDGYESLFIYAGRGVFDGTGKFALANGWKRFLEQKDFAKPTFTTAWGVCNEDLYDRALEEMRSMNAAGKPFFVTTMSVSNHKPYTYPPGRIAENPSDRKRENVVKYTDYALGRFFEKARGEAFWKDTVFVVVADHGARVYGSQTIPIKSYEIPMVILGPAVVQKPARHGMLGCQLDVAPTILGLLGRPYQSTFFGRDLLNTPTLHGRVLLHHNRSVGIYSEQRLVVFNLNKQVDYFTGDPKREGLRRMPEADEVALKLQREATALFQVGDQLYMEGRFNVTRP